jgi:hypothetical protein
VPSTPVGLQALTSLEVTFGLHLDRTTMEISPPGGVPAARLAKPGEIARRLAYDIFTGPGLSEPSGHLTAYGAVERDGAVIGIVNPSHGRVPDAEIHPMTGLPYGKRADNPAHWTVTQAGLPPLSGTAVGLATKLTHNRVAEFVSQQGADLWMFDYAAPLHFQYSAQGSAGFSVSRTPGRAKFAVTIHDERIDRRLPLAVLAAIGQYQLASPATEAVGAVNIARRLLRRRPGK